MSIAPHYGIIDFGEFTPPSGGADGIQGEVPAPLASEAGYILSTAGWIAPPAGTGTVTSVDLTAGTGISVSGGPITTSGSITVTNTAPDQTVVLTASTGISVSGSYPSFTLTNSAPDQIVSLTAGSNITITGTYPSFTIAASGGGGSGTVTSIDVSGGTTGLTFTGGPITTSGTITAGGTLSVANGGTGATTLTGVVIGNGTSAFTVKTNPTGAFVGTTDTQTLTNKTISADDNTLSGIAASSFVLSNSSGNIDGAAAQKVIPSGAVVGTTDTQTLTNKTITGTKETVFTITDGASVDIDPANGGIQLWTLGASRTPTANNFTAGQSVTLLVDDGSAYAITWSSIGVTWLDDASAPTLQTSGYTIIELFKAGSTVYGLARR